MPQVFSAAFVGSLQRLPVALVLFCIPLLAVRSAPAQTFTVLHQFTGGADGGKPMVGLILDHTGNLYGTTFKGGLPGGCNGDGCGVVFKLTQRNSNWIFSPLYTFSGGSDGAWPDGRVIIGQDGSLYGTAIVGGHDLFLNGTGVVFNLRPPAHVPSRALMQWNETVIYTFGNVSDGNYPSGDLTFDGTGNIYGTTQNGGYECGDTTWCGEVYELAHSGGTWIKSTLYAFDNLNVAFPYSGVIFDQVGNLYGTTTNNEGVAFQLTPSGSSWTLHEIHYFGAPGDGSFAVGGLIFDAVGNLYGGTTGGGANGTGAVYKLMPLGGSWAESVIYSLPGNSGNGGGPGSTLAQDAAGNLYGTACRGGSYNSGAVFKLTRSGDGWIPTTLYEFTGGSDGFCPDATLVIDSNSNIYGTTEEGGAYQNGVVFEITP